MILAQALPMTWGECSKECYVRIASRSLQSAPSGDMNDTEKKKGDET